MKLSEIPYEHNPQVIESPHIEAILKIMEMQLRILQSLSRPALFIPKDTDLENK